MYVERHVLAITTDGSGDATAYSPTITGRVVSVIYTKDGTTPYTDGVDFAITAEATGQAILTLTNQNSSAAFQPRVGVCGATGTALTYDGTRTVNEPVTVAQDRVKVVVAQGGATKIGTITLIVG